MDPVEVAAPNLAGLWVPIVTPLTSNGDVDDQALARLARRLLLDGCAGLVALGTTGEPATMTTAERRRVIETCAAVCSAERKPLIVGVGSNCTRATIEDALEVEAAVRPAALLVVVPYYTRPTEAAIVEHMQAVAGSCSTPIVVYNVPYRTGRGLGGNALVELAQTPGIAGLKQAVSSLDLDTLDLLRRRPADFQILSGDDAFIVPTILMGGVGAIAASAHVATAEFARMVDAARARLVDVATELAYRLMPVVTLGMSEPNPAPWKAALCALGEIESPALRPPMSEARSSVVTQLLAAINGHTLPRDDL